MDGSKRRAGEQSLLQTGRNQSWNTNDLRWRVSSDAIAAAGAASLVAPLVCVIDRSIIENASTGKGTTFRECFFRSLRPLYSSPHRFLTSRPFFLIFSVYFSTYATANACDTISATINGKASSAVSTGPLKFVATSAVNMSLGVYKDSSFAKWFNKSTTSSVAPRIPPISFALFAIRDSMTIFASFILPPLLAPKFSELPTQLAAQFNTEKRRNNAAQFLTPAAMQLLSTPLHLLGLDLYNRSGNLSWAQRIARIKRDWGVSALARMGRIVPAFGVGGVVNGNIRRSLLST